MCQSLIVCFIFMHCINMNNKDSFNLSTRRLHLVVFINHCTKRSAFLLRIWDPQGKATLVNVLPMKRTKRLACEAANTIPIHSDRFHDVTDTNCWAQNGSAHGCVFAIFKRWFSAGREIEWRAAVRLLSIIDTLFPGTWPVMLLHFVSPLINPSWFFIYIFNRDRIR